MTVKELIEHLQTLDPEVHVFTKGYEGGLNEVEIRDIPTDVALNVHTAWWYGEHDYEDNVKYIKSKYKTVKGIVL
jgi:hypothetical protein